MGAAFGASRLKSFKWFWAVCGLVTLVWAYGGNTPFYHLIILVPGTKYFRAPSTIIYITAFSVAVLAAIGAERLLPARFLGATRRRGRSWPACSRCLCRLADIASSSASPVPSSASTIRRKCAIGEVSSVIETRAEPNLGDAVLGRGVRFLFAGLAAGLIWATIARWLLLKAASIALATLVVVDLWSIERLYLAVHAARVTDLRERSGNRRDQGRCRQDGSGTHDRLRRGLRTRWSRSVFPQERF